MKPTYKHDCNTCEFLGRLFGYDIYIHPEPNHTFLARYGDRGEEYTSNPDGAQFMSFIVAHPNSDSSATESGGITNGQAISRAE